MAQSIENHPDYNFDTRKIEPPLGKKPIPIILLNGPPKCGKDTIAEALFDDAVESGIPPYMHLKFASPLKKALNALMYESTEELEKYKDIDFYCERQTTTTEALFEPNQLVNRRKLLIALSESLIKPVFGNGHLGRILAKRIDKFLAMRVVESPKGFVISDLGFIDEYNTLIKDLPVLIPGVEFNVQIIQIEREGTNWDGDSRGYVTPNVPGVSNFLRMENNETIKEAVDVIQIYMKVMSSGEFV